MGTGRGECGLGKRKRGDVDEEDVDKGNEGGRKGVKKQRGRETNGGREVHAHVQVGEREGRREEEGGRRGWGGATHCSPLRKAVLVSGWEATHCNSARALHTRFDCWACGYG